MKKIKYINQILIAGVMLILPVSCDKYLDEPFENTVYTENTDYTKTEDMVQIIRGAYATFNDLQWETFPLVAVRGDDVTPNGDQAPLIATDVYNYDRSFWIYNSVWLNYYSDIIQFHAMMEEIDKYLQFASSSAEGNQYKAEIRVLRGYEMLQLSRLWGSLLIPTSSKTEELYNKSLSTMDEVMQHISDEMDEVVSILPDMRPNQRTDIPGGVTKYTALAVKALANLEMKNYQGVADATGAIISSGKFTLDGDYYELFKIPGKLSNENLLEMQYSDYGTGSGASNNYLYAFFGPSNWTPAVAGASGGWGFWQPTLKYIKFMLDRGETVRLETSVIFTNQGIDSLNADPNYAGNLPAFVKNTTRDGDVFGKTDGSSNPRTIFISGKHYLPSNQLIPGRTGYGSNKNFICIRYAEVLLMHAEALKSGATSSAMTADDAVNLVRARAGLSDITGVTLDDVLDEKYAEFAMEWGTRFYDLVRHDKTSELNFSGHSYDASSDRFLPYPLEQQDLLPQLRVDTNN